MGGSASEHDTDSAERLKALSLLLSMLPSITRKFEVKIRSKHLSKTQAV